ncbi:SRPBCC family protein [Amycolatopsis rubida]|uniref:Carbon monoxide dehydrogenase subunit G n=2 Tax=Amycolatopsis TaxID=1813 RepID=A0A2N3WP43_9PSEU|nr:MULTISPECIES: SRPBCC family protein [Amycolatopsis]MYW95064.1 carbon monoxide dehydrogenase [Amycolatopsis rubida]NEC60051.1 SRPBCC family protein [Amycolatopsis rubida]OAP26366.1 Carbon monoxide dehydrogenase subunit G (CoxG) [Amycolatopsis sp. M39]PKV95646.1 carbon monoxide dehydrogenase subunit G [Amycolatopsis niigatensis]SFP39487.1 Carbon monoxide dehydrogenase subunit G [Amycolatopsis rubida]
MLINKDVVVPQPIDKVWAFFNDIPQVAASLPGADLNEDLGDDQYKGKVMISMGPVKLAFGGLAKVLERDDAAKKLVVDGAGSDEKGRGNASLMLTAQLLSVAKGTKVDLSIDLTLSGAAAQYGRGMVSDVTSVLIGQFADNAQRRIEAIERGEDLSKLEAKSASGLAIGLQAVKLALLRVFSRFFLPYQPQPR